MLETSIRDNGDHENKNIIISPVAGSLYQGPIVARFSCNSVPQKVPLPNEDDSSEGLGCSMLYSSTNSMLWTSNKIVHEGFLGREDQGGQKVWKKYLDGQVGGGLQSNR